MQKYLTTFYDGDSERIGYSSPSILQNPDIYMEDSLQDIIKVIENPEIEITNEILVNIVLKYIYAFFYPQSIQQQLPFFEINRLGNFVYDRYNNSENPQENLKKSWRETDTFTKSTYGIKMIADIPATVSCMKDIIQQKKNPNDFNGKYLGIDMGS